MALQFSDPHEAREPLAQGRTSRRTDPIDTSSLESVYDSTASAVYGLFMRMLRDAPVAEELMVQVYGEAGERLRQGAGISSGWLLSRAHGLARRALEQRPREVRAAAGVVPMPPSPGAMPMHVEPARRALAGLDAMDRQILQLAYFVGWPVAEIAGRFGLGENAVRARMREALRSLYTSVHIAEEAGS